MREKLRGLYVITDPILLPGERLLTGVQAALIGGASLVQYRDKLATETERFQMASSLRDMCRDHDAVFIVNDDLGLCQRVQADGVHLGKTDGDVIKAREMLGSERILGVTCHDDAIYAKRMALAGADYCAFGRLFPSNTKPNAPSCSLDDLSILCQVPCATVAIGGIDANNASEVMSCPIDMLALIHGVFGQPNIESAARTIVTLMAS